MSLLTQRDIDSELWGKLRQRVANRLQKLLEENAGDLPADQTAKKRGRIAECRLFLALEKRQETELENEATTDSFNY